MSEFADQFTVQLVQRFKSSVSRQAPMVRSVFDQLQQMKGEQVDHLFHELHQSVFAQVNCMACANCCKTISPIITQQDMDTMARYLRISTGAFITRFLEMDEDGDFVFRQTPCPFLDNDNACRIYDARPKACRQYPHTDAPRMKRLLPLTQRNAGTCPAVWEMVQQIARRIGIKG